ncbi:hypothetical protein [Spirulina sp. 06S082]|uniref:hypothetical protein n=1 Tax=Spirulina sp. 06S082 TaxID=3110248 RepID=UPI002B1F59E7|nr:hypothetical protein [Spirulina sp. 06S082]MEA5472302.1 hypothetical protein [Spirulina sp. 06S082]
MSNVSTFSAKIVQELTNWKTAGIAGGITLSMLLASAGIYQISYGKTNLQQIAISYEEVQDSGYSVKNISLQSTTKENLHYNLDFELQKEGETIAIALDDIDLSLMIPAAPESAKGNAELVKWFILEREFNRQRVVFQADSPHLQVKGDRQLKANNLSVHLTNNCLGAGYWEIAVFAEENGAAKKIYQGFFDFPRGSYKNFVETVNKDSYWQYAQGIESWYPGTTFFKGQTLDFSTLRSVKNERKVAVNDLKNETVFTVAEQKQKANLIVDDTQQDWQTWSDIRHSSVQFQSFVIPGIYDPDRLWKSNYSEIANLTNAVVKDIESPLSKKTLQEIDFYFQNEAGKTRKLVVSGVDLKSLPKLSSQNYSQGLYMPLGYGTPFTQDYEELKQNPPVKNPIFSTLFDESDRIIDYRHDVGINGMVMHQDAVNPDLVHFYLLSYERISIVGHYTVNLNNGDAKSI